MKNEIKTLSIAIILSSITITTATVPLINPVSNLSQQQHQNQIQPHQQGTVQNITPYNPQVNANNNQQIQQSPQQLLSPYAVNPAFNVSPEYPGNAQQPAHVNNLSHPPGCGSINSTAYSKFDPKQLQEIADTLVNLLVPKQVNPVMLNNSLMYSNQQLPPYDSQHQVIPNSAYNPPQNSHPIRHRTFPDYSLGLSI